MLLSSSHIVNIFFLAIDSYVHLGQQSIETHVNKPYIDSNEGEI